MLERRLDIPNNIGETRRILEKRIKSACIGELKIPGEANFNTYGIPTKNNADITTIAEKNRVKMLSINFFPLSFSVSNFLIKKGKIIEAETRDATIAVTISGILNEA